MQRNLKKAIDEENELIGQANRRMFEPALLPTIFDGSVCVYDEVYVYQGRIVDRGRSIHVARSSELEFASNYLDSGFDARVIEARFVEVQPISMETGKSLNAKTGALHLRLKVLDRKYPKVVDAIYPIDYQSASGARILLPDAMVPKQRQKRS